MIEQYLIRYAQLEFIDQHLKLKNSNMKAAALKHTDVQGKVLYYVSVNNGNETHYINIGEKTYQKLNSMQEWKPTPLSNGEQKAKTSTSKQES